MKKEILVLVSIVSTGVFAANTAVCAGCHGQNFEKKALNVSKVVKEMSKDEIVASLKAYKAGTGGHTPMKATMQAQAKNLSDADIEAIAEQIAGNNDSGEKSVSDQAVEKAKEMAQDVAEKAVDTAKEKATDMVEKKVTDAAKGMLK